MSWAGWLAIVAALLVVFGTAGLGIYGGRVHPATRHYEQVVPDDRLPH